MFDDGAKAGILRDLHARDKERLLRAFARGRADEVPKHYVFGLDMGLAEEDAAIFVGALNDRGVSTGLPRGLGGLPYDQLGVAGYGAANLPTTARAREVLHERGIAVVPDFIANAGGIIAAAHSSDARNSPFVVEPEGVLGMISEKLRANALRVVTDSLSMNIPALEAAHRLAKERVMAAMKLRGFTPEPSREAR